MEFKSSVINDFQDVQERFDEKDREIIALNQAVTNLEIKIAQMEKRLKRLEIEVLS